MNNHISTEEWVLLYSGNMSLTDKLPILNHCAECPKCKALMDAANNLKFSLNMRKDNSMQTSSEEEYAYRAVAGIDDLDSRVEKSGFLSFHMEKTDDGYRFTNEDPASDGWANRYAMNLSSDGKQFLEDAGALSATITGNSILLKLKDCAVKGAARLILDGEELPPAVFNDELILDLPSDGYCELEIVFMEG